MRCSLRVETLSYDNKRKKKNLPNLKVAESLVRTTLFSSSLIFHAFWELLSISEARNGRALMDTVVALIAENCFINSCLAFIQ